MRASPLDRVQFSPRPVPGFYCCRMNTKKNSYRRWQGLKSSAKLMPLNRVPLTSPIKSVRKPCLKYIYKRLSARLSKYSAVAFPEACVLRHLRAVRFDRMSVIFRSTMSSSTVSLQVAAWQAKGVKKEQTFQGIVNSVCDAIPLQLLTILNNINNQ